jgi:hypothetical protein
MGGESGVVDRLEVPVKTSRRAAGQRAEFIGEMSLIGKSGLSSQRRPSDVWAKEAGAYESLHADNSAKVAGRLPDGGLESAAKLPFAQTEFAAPAIQGHSRRTLTIPGGSSDHASITDGPLGNYGAQLGDNLVQGG